MVTPDGKWITFDGGETFSLVPGYTPEHSSGEPVDDEGRPLLPYLCEQCGDLILWLKTDLEGRPVAQPHEGLTLVIDHRMHCAATH